MWMIAQVSGGIKQKVNHNTKSSTVHTKKGWLTVLHFDHVSHTKEETTIKKIHAWCRFWFLSGQGRPSNVSKGGSCGGYGVGRGWTGDI